MTTATMTELVAMFNRTLNRIDEANKGFKHLTPIRPYQENVQARNQYLHQIMNHQPHQAEY